MTVVVIFIDFLMPATVIQYVDMYITIYVNILKITFPVSTLKKWTLERTGLSIVSLVTQLISNEAKIHTQAHTPPKAWEHVLPHEVSGEPTQAWPWLPTLLLFLKRGSHHHRGSKHGGCKNLMTGPWMCNEWKWIQIYVESEVSEQCSPTQHLWSSRQPWFWTHNSHTLTYTRCLSHHQPGCLKHPVQSQNPRKTWIAAFLKRSILLLCMCARVCVYVYVHRHMGVLRRQKWVLDVLELGFYRQLWTTWYRYWKSNSSFLQEQPVIFPTSPPLQSQWQRFYCAHAWWFHCEK